jgi:hypothetical protein
VPLFLKRIRKLRKPERDLTAELGLVEKSVVTVITETDFRERQLTMCPTNFCREDRKMSVSETLFSVHEYQRIDKTQKTKCH